MGQSGGGNGNGIILSAGKSNEKLLDRFIPFRIGENLQAKFEAVSQSKEEEEKLASSSLFPFSSHPASASLAADLGFISLNDAAGTEEE